MLIFFFFAEPGYYLDDHFGIRIENIVKVITAETSQGSEHFLTFVTVTMVPIQLKLLIPEMLTRKQKEYLNNYHAQCRATIGVILQEAGDLETYEWLLRETEPLP